MKKIITITLALTVLSACRNTNLTDDKQYETKYNVTIYTEKGDTLETFKATKFKEWDNGSKFVKKDGTSVFYSLPVKVEFKK